MSVKVIVTSGGTRESIDDFRFITNVSTGALGCRIVEAFLDAGHSVVMIRTKRSDIPQAWVNAKALKVIEVSTVLEAKAVIEKELPNADAIIHAMAVADFGIKVGGKGKKLKSNDLEGFIEFLRDNLVKNPKLISEFKTINPKAVVVGFKFETGKWGVSGPLPPLFDIARDTLVKNGCSFVVANDKKRMTDTGKHEAMFVFEHGYDVVVGKIAIAQKIVELVGNILGDPK